MDEDMDEISRRLFTFTLEIISLLSGEDYTIVRKTPGDCVTPIIHLQESGGRSPITAPPPHSPIHERSKKRILELSNKMIGLLSGEVPIRCQDVAVYLSMEEWEYLEGHKDRYEEVVEKQWPVTPQDGSRRKNPLERCPRPLCPQDCPEESHSVPESYQCADLIDIKVEVIDEAEETMELWADPQDGLMDRNPPERCPRPLYPQDCPDESHSVLERCPRPLYPQDCPEESHSVPERCPRPLYPQDCPEESHSVPERCPRPLYPQDCPEESHSVPERHQEEELTIIKVEEEEEERMNDGKEENPAAVTTVPKKKHLSMGKTSELSQELRNLIVAKHTDGIGYKRISKLLNVPVSTVGAIIRKWKQHHFTINRPRTGAPRKISDIGVHRMIKKIVQEPRTTCGELQKDLESTGTTVSRKTINNTLNLYGLYAHSSRKPPLLKKKQG